MQSLWHHRPSEKGNC